MNAQILSSLVPVTVYIIKEIFNTTWKESVKIYSAVKNLFADASKKRELPSMPASVSAAYERLPSISTLRQVTASSFPSAPTKKKEPPSFHQSESFLRQHFARVAAKGRPSGGYISKALEPPKPRKGLMQMMREEASKTAVRKETGLLSPPAKVVPKPGVPPMPTKKAPTAAEVKHSLLKEELSKPITAADVQIRKLGTQLCNLGIFGRESLSQFLTYTYEQQKALLDGAVEMIPSFGLGDKCKDALNALASLRNVLFTSKDDRKDKLKEEIHSILNEFVLGEFMERKDADKFLTLNIVDRFGAINNGIKQASEEGSRFANQLQYLIRLAQIVYELHTIDLPTKSRIEQLSLEITTILNQLDIAGVIDPSVLESFPKLGLQTQLDKIDEAISRIKSEFPSFKGLVPNLQKLKDLIVEDSAIRSRK